MAIFDTVTFAEIDGVTGAPTFDGWTGDVDPGVTTNKAESGYAVGGRLTYSGGAGFPPVAVQALRMNVGIESPLGVAAGSYLAMSFFCTYDFTFDNDDAVVIALMPAPLPTPAPANPPYTSQRRIDIFPVHNVDGAGGAGAPTTTLPGSGGTDYDARLSQSERQFVVWAGVAPTGGAPPDRWQTMAVTRSNFLVRTASWRPSTLSTKTTAATPVSTATAADVPVVDASRFPPSGEFQTVVGTQPNATLAYTGRSTTTGANKLTGCKVVSGTGGTIASGESVKLLDVGWSLEVLIPTTAALGTNAADPNGLTWIDLQKEFGLYLNLVRFSRTAPSGTPITSGYYASQYRFPLLDATANQPFVKTLDTKTAIEPSWYGVGLIPALGASNRATGVRFQNYQVSELSIGVKHPSTGDLLTRKIFGQNGTEDNTLAAEIENINPAASAPDVTAEFRFANWGIGSLNFGDWDPASAHGADPATSVTLGPGTAAAPTRNTITQKWARANVPTDYQANMGHHCMWVRLTSPSGVGFIQAGARANLDFENLSDAELAATVSGKGHAPPASGGRHQFLLFPHVREVRPLQPDDNGGEIGLIAHERLGISAATPTQTWVWVVEALRRTGETMTVGGNTAEILDPSPGQFALSASHAAADDVFSYSLAGDDLQRRGRVYELGVPHNGEAVVQVKVRAAPESQPLPDPQSPGGDVPWWLRFLRWLIHLIRRLFGGS
jgi:hypothetical protein